MYRRLISYLLCITMSCTGMMPVSADPRVSSGPVDEAQILQKYPQAKIIHVTPEEYPGLAEQLRSQGYDALSSGRTAPALYADAQTYPEIEPPVNLPDPENRPVKDDDCNDRPDNDSSASEESLRVMVDFSSDMMKSGSDNRESAAVVFVIIGTVLIVMWALYVFKYMYDVAAGFKPCGKWSDLVLTASAISSSDTQHAKFTGLRYMTGFRDGATDVGISVELGQSEILLDAINLPEMKGTYWFLGPVLRWRFSSGRNPHYFQMNFLAGSTEHDAVGVIAQANLGLQFGISDNVNLGFSWGAMNIDLNNDQGLITERDQYYYLYGVSMGLRF